MRAPRRPGRWACERGRGRRIGARPEAPSISAPPGRKPGPSAGVPGGTGPPVPYALEAVLSHSVGCQEQLTGATSCHGNIGIERSSGSPSSTRPTSQQVQIFDMSPLLKSVVSTARVQATQSGGECFVLPSDIDEQPMGKQGDDRICLDGGMKPRKESHIDTWRTIRAATYPTPNTSVSA